MRCWARPGRVAKGEQKHQAEGSGDGERVAAGRERILNLRGRDASYMAECRMRA